MEATRPCFFALIPFLFKVEIKQFLPCNRLNRFYLVRGLPRFYLIKDFCSWINVFECNRWNLWSESLKPRDLAFTARKFANISFRFSEISSDFRELKNSLRYFVSLCEFSSDLAKFRRTFVELSRERCKSSHEISPIFRRKFARTINEIRWSSLLLLLHSTVAVSPVYTCISSYYPPLFKPMLWWIVVVVNSCSIQCSSHDNFTTV